MNTHHTINTSTNPAYLSAKRDFVIAQISDLHLSKHNPASMESFLAVLDLAKNHKPNLLLLTGDLVNDGITALYDWLFEMLAGTHIPFLCLAGNHDVTCEIGHDLPFECRQFLPIKADDRLANTHRIVIDLPNVTWQVLAVNSAVHGQIYGMLGADTLDFLKDHLSCNLPTLIALHHHPSPVGSAWIDGYMLKNSDEFWATLAPHTTHPLHIVCGHVHQAHTLSTEYGTLHTCPATSRQFTPYQENFGIDTVSAGCRLIRLDGMYFQTDILRLP